LYPTPAAQNLVPESRFVQGKLQRLRGSAAVHFSSISIQ
jgi:hypothetical protein